MRLSRRTLRIGLLASAMVGIVAMMGAGCASAPRLRGERVQAGLLILTVPSDTRKAEIRQALNGRSDVEIRSIEDVTKLDLGGVTAIFIDASGTEPSKQEVMSRVLRDVETERALRRYAWNGGSVVVSCGFPLQADLLAPLEFVGSSPVGSRIKTTQTLAKPERQQWTTDQGITTQLHMEGKSSTWKQLAMDERGRAVVEYRKFENGELGVISAPVFTKRQDATELYLRLFLEPLEKEIAEKESKKSTTKRSKRNDEAPGTHHPSTLLQLSIVPSVQLFDESYDVKGLRLGLIGENRDVTGLDLGFFGVQENVNGISIQALGSWNRSRTKGLQLGLFAFGGSFEGIQMGTWSFIEDDSSGLQLAVFQALAPFKTCRLQGLQVSSGISGVPFIIWVIPYPSISGGSGLEMEGLQLCACTNWAASLEGVQLSGLVSWAQRGSGAQVSGLVSIAAAHESSTVPLREQGEFGPLQLSGLVSYATDMHGLQMSGVCNRAKKLHGIQLGLFNSCDDLSGVQIGLLNFTPNSRFSFMPLVNASFFNPARQGTEGGD